jgi:hypothetical protein
MVYARVIVAMLVAAALTTGLHFALPAGLLKERSTELALLSAFWAGFTALSLRS